MPVTIRQLKNATHDHVDDAFKVDGAELLQVKIVGSILKVDETSTFTKFDVEDSTGVVEVKLWLDAGEDESIAERRSACREGTYVRVIGSVRSFQDSLHIVSHDIRPLVDFNEVTHHFLEAIHLHCLHTKAPPNPQSTGWGSQGAPVPAPQHSGTAVHMHDNNAHANSGFTKEQQQVLSFFNQNDNQDDDGTGLSLEYVSKALIQQGISDQAIRAAVEFLSNEGHLYSTIDDNHYKSTS